MIDHYLWFKAVHIIAVTAWMAGLLYLPRLFVYHSRAGLKKETSETLKIMERRLYFGIMMPAMVLSLIMGVLLGIMPGVVEYSGEGWVWVKVFCVLGLLGCHGVFGRWRRAFELDRNIHTPTFYKVANEAPTVLMVLIIIMVVVKPF